MTNNLDDALPDLMRRATEHLEPESTDLVERGLRRGVQLRRRRTAVLSFSGAGAILATAGIIVGGTQLFGGTTGDAPVAGPPLAVATSSTPSPKPTPQPTALPKTDTTLPTLKSLLPPKYKQSAPYTWGGDAEGFNGASIVLNDGKGASQVVAWLSREGGTTACTPDREGLENCSVRPDGSVLTWSKERQTNPPAPGKPARVDDDIVENTVQLTYPDGRVISLINYNGAGEKGAPATRVKPVLTIGQLTSIASSKRWEFPTAADTKTPERKSR
ncbi:hypothetical protein FB561_3380 [Kribbella amoyensis]|uniref:Uncharacterized protein n=1 Tax=Kribbella amoyensis TaxID=996641 RepID=A0A561BTV3_9ACTN|nr:hypothetical protein [Kribbella amoyensis]TWD82251.1 hypothetical protein FB561_3380 [Kribbella amoyensis]